MTQSAISHQSASDGDPSGTDSWDRPRCQNMGQAARRSLPPLLCSITVACVNVSESDRETATVNIFGSESAGITPQIRILMMKMMRDLWIFVVYNGIHPA